LLHPVPTTLSVAGAAEGCSVSLNLLRWLSHPRSFRRRPGVARNERSGAPPRFMGVRTGPNVATPSALPTLLGTTVRRSLVVGRISLAISCFMVVVYSAGFGFGGPLLISIGAYILPIFAVAGGIGGALVYSNDRLKGVLEYIVAYGLRPQRLLVNAVVASAVQVSIILALGIGAGVTTYLLSGHPMVPALVVVLLGYTIPMSFLSAGLMTTVGVYWTSLASPRSGMNSPLGVLPMIGLLPTGAVLILALAAPRAHAAQLVGAAELVIFIVLMVLWVRNERFMPTERLLSPG
jgi:hypothetical protein